MLQGLFFTDKALMPLSDSLQHCLAGNAFSATTVMVPLLAMLTLLGEAQKRREPLPMSSMPTAPVERPEPRTYVHMDVLEDTDDLCNLFDGIPLPAAWSCLGA